MRWAAGYLALSVAGAAVLLAVAPRLTSGPPWAAVLWLLLTAAALTAAGLLALRRREPAGPGC